MAGKSNDKSAPVWAIPVAVVVVLVVVAFIAWKSLGSNSAAGDLPPVQVKPGMIDFKKEAASGHLGGGLKGMSSGSN